MNFNTSRVLIWVTVTWVILVSYSRRTNAGPVAFATCVSQAAGPICASAAATGILFFYFYFFHKLFNISYFVKATAACASTAWLPPLFCSCVAGLMGVTCGASCCVCIASFFSPTP